MSDGCDADRAVKLAVDALRASGRPDVTVWELARFLRLDEPVVGEILEKVSKRKASWYSADEMRQVYEVRTTLSPVLNLVERNKA